MLSVLPHFPLIRRVWREVHHALQFPRPRRGVLGRPDRNLVLPEQDRRVTGPGGRQLGSELPPQAVSFRTVQAGTRWSAILSFDDAISLTD